MKMIKRILLMLTCNCLVVAGIAQAQSIEIDSCYERARRNYPLVKQYELIERSRMYSIDNANKGYLPQFSMSGQATYQSAVTEIPIKLPNVNIEPLGKDQYKLFGEVSQSITDLFVIHDQKDMVMLNSDIERQKVEVELYKVKERINSLFFGILLIDATIQQTHLMMKDIQSGIDKAKIAIENGVMLKSSAENLKAEMLKANQRMIELKSNRRGFADMLSMFIQRPVHDTDVFVKPNHPIMTLTAVSRPELRLFELQKKTLDVQSKLVTAKNLPRVNAFFQGGVGRPALNMLSNELNGYYLAGLRLSWNITGFYTFEGEQKNITLNQNSLDVQRDAFLFNANLQLQQQNSEIAKIKALIESDSSMILIRESIKNTLKNQLEHGTATTNDFLTAVNAQDMAQQNLLLHEIQLLVALYNYQTILGK